MTKKLKIVNFLRGFAIFTIVLMHLVSGYDMPGVLKKASALGGAGVHVFILCSGLGLYLSYLKKPLGYGEFLKRRFTKIYWPYAVCVMAWGVWFMVTTGVLPMKEAASHLLLYKMFSTELDVSLCYPYWFISTIVQFYLAWPLMVKLIQNRGGYCIALVVSLLWATTAGLLGYEECRPWGSFFLQYLWEFCLGMLIAERLYAYKEEHGEWPWWTNVREWKWWWVVTAMVVGMGLNATMAWSGGMMKLYNDVPSLVGYGACALTVYKLGWKWVNKFFEWTSGFGYEWYLVHSLVFAIMRTATGNALPVWVEIIICLCMAYITAWLFHRIWMIKLNK